MKFISIINKEIALGMSMNALAHMSVGLGHRLQGKPDVSIYFGSAEQVKKFRSLASSSRDQHPDESILSDFPHTMSGVSGGTSDAQVALTASVSENEMSYFGACFISQSIDKSMLTLLQSCSQLIDYTSFSSEEKASILPPSTTPAPMVPDMKLTMLINGKQPVAKTINAVVLSGLSVGKAANYSQLSLVDLIDKDGNHHPNISYHPFPILKSDTPAKYESMIKISEKMPELVSLTIRDTKDKLNPPLATTVFGTKSAVEKAIVRKDTRLFQNILKENDLTPASCLELVSNEIEEFKKNASSSHFFKNSPIASNQEEQKKILSSELDKQIKQLREDISCCIKSALSPEATQRKLDIGLNITKDLLKENHEKISKLIVIDVLNMTSVNGDLNTVKYILNAHLNLLAESDIHAAINLAEKNQHSAISEILKLEIKDKTLVSLNRFIS